MIEVSIAYDKEFNSLSDFAQLLFLKILPHTDDYGRFDGDPETIKARVDPLSKKKVDRYKLALEEMCKAGLIIWYKIDANKSVIQYKQNAFERINAFLIKQRGNPEYPEHMDSYESICEHNTYKVKSNKYKVESKEMCQAHPLQIFISTELPTVSKLKDQLTEEHAKKLLIDFDESTIKETLLAMENYKQLLVKYKSVNLTLRNWIKLRNERGKNGTSAGIYAKHITEDKLKRIADDIANDKDLK